MSWQPLGSLWVWALPVPGTLSQLPKLGCLKEGTNPSVWCLLVALWTQ